MADTFAHLIPKAETEPENTLETASILLHGAPGVGKSTLCSLFPNPLFLGTEDGLKYIRARKVTLEDWEHFRKMGAALAESGHGLKTVIIDTATLLFDICKEYIEDDRNVKNIADIGWGKGDKYLVDEFEKRVRKFLALPMTKILICHSTQEVIQTPSGEATRYAPDLNPKISGWLRGLVDSVVYFAQEKCTDEEARKLDSPYKRVLRTKNTYGWFAKDRTGCIPDNFLLTEDPECIERLFKEFAANMDAKVARRAAQATKK